MSKRDRRILRAIEQGVRTSRDLAQLFGAKQTQMAVALSRLAGLGLLEFRSREQALSRGRPCNCWRSTRSPA
jgi:predicted ArsR family transcriptional regulator